MKLCEVRDVLKAQVLVGEELLDKVEIETACGSDLMSDVLAFTKEKTLLLTGLTNQQVVRTAEMSDIAAIVFVRGKMPGEDTLALAKEGNIPILFTQTPLFETCGILYRAGLRGCSQVGKTDIWEGIMP